MALRFRTVNQLNLYLALADCECVNLPTRRLPRENIPLVSANPEKRPLSVVVRRLKLTDHFDVPPVVRCIQQLPILSLHKAINL